MLNTRLQLLSFYHQFASMRHYNCDPSTAAPSFTLAKVLDRVITVVRRYGIRLLCCSCFIDKVLACAKHFVGDGGTQNGIDENNFVINAIGLFKIRMLAYLDSTNKGVSTVMISYSSWNGVKMHANHQLIIGYLKNKLKFRGFTISDWEGLQRITSSPGLNYRNSVELGIKAGVDIVYSRSAKDSENLNLTSTFLFPWRIHLKVQMDS